MTESAGIQPQQQSQPVPVDSCDIAILGAGPVGLTLALKLKEAGLDIVLIDHQDPRRTVHNDPRALALSEGTRQLLAGLDAWPAEKATPIHDIHVSQRGGFGRTYLDCREYGLPALGYVLRYGHLSEALLAPLSPVTESGSETRAGTPARLMCGWHVAHTQLNGRRRQLTLKNEQGETRLLDACLLVHAEGTPSAGDPAVRVLPYGQHAIVCEATPLAKHNHRAWERFTPDGPLALLPLQNDYSVVFTVPADRVEHLMQQDDPAFLHLLEKQFGRTAMRFGKVGPRAHFPLALRFRKNTIAPREVWIGNSAQTLHPVSGQGFNLGIRDAWELAESILRQAGCSADVGEQSVLSGYAHGRRIDRHGSAFFTDSIVRLFSNNVSALRLGRGLGLFALDLCPPARHFVARRMMFGARG